MMVIRRLNQNDLEALWALRLQALGESPESFGSTYEETVARGKESILQRLQYGGENNFYFGAFDNNLTLVGMVGFVRPAGVKERHKADIVSLYVLPTARGQGIARAMMQAVIDYARQQPALEQLHLSVVTTALPARNLYRSLGFQTYGTAPRALKLGDRYFDEAFMLLELQAETPD
jgi:ribosomal protein S18 acetylase RimI-like enzyme